MSLKILLVKNYSHITRGHNELIKHGTFVFDINPLRANFLFFSEGAQTCIYILSH